jgi:PAS domain S-box-containing protein
MPLSKDHLPLLGSISPSLLLLTGVSITLLLFGLVIWEALNAHGAYRSIAADEVALDRLYSDLSRLDESLTVSALLNIATADSSWAIMYDTTRNRLDQAIEHAAAVLDTLPTGTELMSVRQAHARRVETEEKAMRLARQGHTAAAQILLSSDDYLQRKHAYMSSIEAALDHLNDHQESAGRSLKRNLEMGAALTGFVVLAAWLSIYGVLQVNFRRRRAAEQILRESEARYRALTESAFDDIVLTEHGIVIEASEKFARIFGYSPWELKGKPVADLVAPDYRDLVLQNRQSGYARPYELVCLRKDGSAFPVEVCGQTIPYHGRSARVTALRDISDRKKAEAERETLIRELKAKNDELASFTYTISHDLKSPLITIGGFVKWVERDALSGNRDRMKANIERIATTARRMERLIDSLLKFSHAGHSRTCLEPVELGELIREAIEMADGRIMQRGVIIRTAPYLPVVIGDRARLLEVMLNLIDNAIKFMGDQKNPSIDIGIRPSDDGPVVFVRDNGIGIEPCHHNRILNLFEKVDPVAEGSGVGLALVKRIVEQHDGSLWVESEGLGRGTTFCLRLPVVENAKPIEKSSIDGGRALN